MASLDVHEITCLYDFLKHFPDGCKGASGSTRKLEKHSDGYNVVIWHVDVFLGYTDITNFINNLNLTNSNYKNSTPSQKFPSNQL